MRNKGPLRWKKNGWDRYGGEWKQDSKFLGRVFEPLSLHPENRDLLQTSGGVFCNRTKISKPYKFQNGDLFNKAILYDLWIRHTEHGRNLQNPSLIVPAARERITKQLITRATPNISKQFIERIVYWNSMG